MCKMKTLAAFKRELTIGSKWQAFYIPTTTDLGIREVEIVQSNAVAFKKNDGKISWLQFPKASEYNFEDGWVQIYFPETYFKPKELVLIYKKI